MVAERAFHPFFIGLDVTLQDDLRVSRNFQIHGLALDHFHGRPAQVTGHDHFINIRRKRNGPGKRNRRVRPDRHRYFDLVPTFPLSIGKMARAVLLHLPMHAGSGTVENLHPVHTAVTLPVLRILGKN